MILDTIEKNLTNPHLFDRLGNRAVSLVQRNIEQGPWAPNAPLTASVKQGNRPLRDRGQLLSSITYRVEGNRVIVGTNHVAAEILHNGGTIRPKRAKALAIPAGPWVRTLMRGTDLQPRVVLEQLKDSGWSVWRQKNVILGQAPGEKEPIPLYILMTAVTIPARPFMRLGAEDSASLSRYVVDILEGRR